MTITPEAILTTVLIIGAFGGWYLAIKKIGAAEMKTDQKIANLETTVTALSTRLTIAEGCGTDNDKAIGEIKIDLEWIKEGIREIKKLLGDKRVDN
jgi:hypothetical protein